ncbi:hypothetical protein OG21DRAFT_388947 [Imleria badia]|nr:hypothetical protein OG21DRAFT_388947 [Imleria badia]
MTICSTSRPRGHSSKSCTSTITSRDTPPCPRSGFCHLLQHCPRLQELTIVIDTRGSEWIDVTRPVVRNHRMFNLGLGNSFLDDLKHVASILCAIFPSLKEVDMTWRYNFPSDYPKNGTRWALWQELNRHLGDLRKCRDSERSPPASSLARY